MCRHNCKKIRLCFRLPLCNMYRASNYVHLLQMIFSLMQYRLRYCYVLSFSSLFRNYVCARKNTSTSNVLNRLPIENRC